MVLNMNEVKFFPTKKQSPLLAASQLAKKAKNVKKT